MHVEARLRRQFDLKRAVAAAPCPAAVEMTFAELCEAYCAVVFDGADLRMRKWLGLFGPQSAWTITAPAITAAAEAMLSHGYRPSTVNRDVSQIGSIFKWARRRRLCPPGFVSPTTGTARYDEAMRVVSITADEIARLLAGAFAFRDRRFAPYVRLLHDTGARKAEILERTWADYDLDARHIVADKTKTGRPRVLFFSEETAALIRRVWPTRAPDALPFEGKARGVPVSYRTAWEKLVASIGRPDLHQHDMRHHRAAELLRAGSTIAVAAQVLGHSSLILQRRYGHLETAHLRAAASASWGT